MSVNTQLAASDQKNTKTPIKSKKHMSIIFENKDIRIDFFFVFDPKHESVSFLRPNGLWFKVFGVKTKKIKENENTSKKYISIVFENKDIRSDFFSFLTQNKKVLVF